MLEGCKYRKETERWRVMMSNTSQHNCAAAALVPKHRTQVRSLMEAFRWNGHDLPAAVHTVTLCPLPFLSARFGNRWHVRETLPYASLLWKIGTGQLSSSCPASRITAYGYCDLSPDTFSTYIYAWSSLKSGMERDKHWRTPAPVRQVP